MKQIMKSYLAGRKRAGKVVLGLFCIVLLATCGNYQPRKFVVGGTQNIAILIIVAQQKGFFKAENVDVEYRPLQSGKITFDAIQSRQIDLALLLDANLAFLGFAGPNDVRVIAQIMEKSDDGILARRDHGISRPGDLVGKRVGYLPASTNYVFLHKFAQRNNLDLTKMTLVPMSPPTMQAAIVHGDVDAVSVWQPYRLNAMGVLGDKSVQFDNDGIYWTQVLLSVRSDTESSKGPELAQILKALSMSAAYVNTHREECIYMVSRAIGVDKNALERTWSHYRFGVTQADPPLVGRLVDLGNWISATQPELRGKPMPDYKQFLAPRILRGVQQNQ